MVAPFSIKGNGWKHIQTIVSKSFTCGYCDAYVSSNKGLSLHQHSDSSGPQIGGVYVCPNCNGMSFITPYDQQFPGHNLGNSVNHLPNELNCIYEEARKCSSNNCFNATVMLCRKILMNVAVGQGALENLSYLEYVNYLADKGFIPPNGKHWVDHIRKKGNQANHEINLMEEKDARELLIFVEMLLKFVHEFPNMVNPEDSEN